MTGPASDAAVSDGAFNTAFDAETAAAEVMAAMRPLADAERAAQASRYLKSDGWVLRETAKKDPAYVTAWTQRHLDLMSGVTFTEAVRRLPPDEAARLRALYRK